MKNAPHRGQRWRALRPKRLWKATRSPAAICAHRDFKPCNFGSKREDVHRRFFDGLLKVDAALFIRSGRKPFVQPASTRNYYGGAFQRTVQWRGELARAILTVVLDKAK